MSATRNGRKPKKGGEPVPALETGITPHARALADSITTSALSELHGIVALPLDLQVQVVNTIRRELHRVSPFRGEPVDCVQWVFAELVEANDYNPNTVAPPEMKLLELSVGEDGYTQPIVTWRAGFTKHEVVDGFHRHRVGRESEAVRARVKGYLPVVTINDDRTDRGDRIAATIRHNRARGKHRVDAMSDIVVELKRRNWSDEKIAKNLGMDADEVLRLCQITGMAEAFKDADFSKSWDIGFEGDVEPITFEDGENVEPANPDRIHHTYEKWECYPAGFYDTKHPVLSDEEAKEAYRAFLADLPAFEAALKRVLGEWPNSCEHYLTNEAMNRIAWLGQASACLALGLPSRYRPGYFLLTEDQQRAADNLALSYLNLWLEVHGRPTVDLDGAGVRAQVNLY